MTSLIIKSIQHLLSMFGLKISRSTEKKVKLNFRWLTNMQIATVIDIGANVGQSVDIYRQLCPKAVIYSFEPLHDCYEQLISRTQRDDNVKAFKLALSDTSGKMIINRNQFSAASSFFEIKNQTQLNYPATSGKILQEEIQVERLDSFFENSDLESPILIKLDVQGAEAKVIKGGNAVFKKASVVVVEMSFEPLYDNQPLFDDIYQMLKELGFTYVGNAQQSYSSYDGHIIFVDSIFIK